MKRVQSYSFGQITIDEKTYTNDLIITPAELYTDWWRKEGHKLQLEDLEQIIEPFPDILVIGTGTNGRMKISSDVMNWLKNEVQIKIITEKSTKAVKKYNKLIEEKKSVGLAIHLTC